MGVHKLLVRKWCLVTINSWTALLSVEGNSFKIKTCPPPELHNGVFKGDFWVSKFQKKNKCSLWLLVFSLDVSQDHVQTGKWTYPGMEMRLIIIRAWYTLFAHWMSCHLCHKPAELRKYSRTIGRPITRIFRKGVTWCLMCMCTCKTRACSSRKF